MKISPVSHREQSLLRIVASEALSTTASSIAFTAIPLIAMTKLGSGAIEIGVLAAAGSAAPLLLGLSAGAMADRLDKQKTLFTCGLARLLLMCMLCVVSFRAHANVPLLCVVGFGLSTAKLVFDSVVMSALPQMVQPDELPKANGWMEAANSVAYAVGPAIAGWMVLSSSAAAPFLMCCALYAGSMALLRGPNVSQLDPPMESSASHFHEILDGIRVLWRDKVQRAIAISAALFNLFHSAFFAVLAVYLVRDLSFAPNVYGGTISCVGLMGLLAALFGPRLVRKLDIRLTLAGSLLLVGPIGIPILYIADAAFPLQVIAVALCLAAWDFMIVLHVIVEQTIRQTTVCETHLGRVSATTRFIAWGADPIGALAGGAVAASLGANTALTICLFGFAASGAALLVSRNIRELRYSDLCGTSRIRESSHSF